MGIKEDDCSLKFFDNPRLYDLISGTFDSDFQFYIELIEKYGQPVLELMCGTGRLTIPYTQKGIDITGLDLSEVMLDYAQIKAAKIGVDVDLIGGDCRDFALDRKFKIIFIPFSSLQLLASRTELEACLTSVKAHLDTDGRFIFDIFNPSLKILNRDPEKNYGVCEFSDNDVYGKTVVTERTSYDNKSQALTAKWLFNFEQADKNFESVLKMRVYFPQEIDAILSYFGFTIEHKYGNYDFSKFESGSPKQLIVCKRR